MKIAIAGAGLAGRLLGWQLTEDGHEVVIHEKRTKGDRSSTSFVAASMLAPISEYPDCEPSVYDMALESVGLWRSWLPKLGVDHGFDGSVLVAHAQDAALLHKFQRTLSLADVDGVNQLSSEALASLEPALAERFTSGLHLEGEGWLDNRGLLDALEQRCGSIRFNSHAHPDSLEGDVVVDCRGIDSDESELRGVRGEIVRVRAPEVELNRPVRLMHPKYQLYISPRADHVYVIGATQIESASDASMSVRSALELLSAAYTVHAGFAEAEIVELSVGIRPAYPDNLPRVQWRDGVLNVNGLYRHGYLIAPSVIKAAQQEVNSVCKYSLTAS